MFKIISKKDARRSGKIKTKSGEVNTPFFIPIASKGAVKNITPEELKDIGGRDYIRKHLSPLAAAGRKINS